MGARFSGGIEDSDAVAERADQLRAEASELAEQDARAYAAVLEAYRSPRDDEVGRRARIRAALATATEVPLAIVACAREVGALAVRLTTEGNPNLHGDVVTGLNLAEAAARSATHLMRLNVRLGDLEREPLERAEAWSAKLGAAVQAVHERRT